MGFISPYSEDWGFPVKQKRTCLPMKETPETWLRSLSQDDPLEKRAEVPSSILAPGKSYEQEPVGLQSIEVAKDSDPT